jgi:hypothetical protein
MAPESRLPGNPLARTHMRVIRTILVLLLLLIAPARISAQDPQSRALATSLGLLAGAAGGGYVTVTVVVFEARIGRYIHDVDDVLGWRSAPFIMGALAGGGLGFFSPERLQGAIVYGAGGLALGGLTGLVIGQRLWDPPEGRWAGAAIGAGVGLVVGNAIGILYPLNIFTQSEGSRSIEANGVPIVFRIPL